MIWYVALGSAAGGVARWLLGGVFRWFSAGFPGGTLLVNVTGCFLIGILTRYAMDSTTITPELRALLVVGFCGGYTTFSAFSYETLRLAQDGEWTQVATYIGASVVLSLAAVALGWASAGAIQHLRQGA